MAYLSAMIDDEQPSNVIEIGTSIGGLACLLGLHCKQIGASFNTFDIKPPYPNYLEYMRQFGANFVFEDVFGPPGNSLIRSILSGPGKTILLCDGGDKKREVREFAPLLKVGDIIGAHDYQTDPAYWGWCEVETHALDDVVDKCGLEPYHPENFIQAAWWMHKKVR